LAERHAGVFEQLACNLEADLTSYFAECKPVFPQVPAHGAAVHRKQTGHCDGRTGAPEQFIPKHPAQVRCQKSFVSLSGGWHLHRSLLPGGLQLPAWNHLKPFPTLLFDPMRHPIEINDSGGVENEPPASTPMNPSTRRSAVRRLALMKIGCGCPRSGQSRPHRFDEPC
jgi:hypothetical protein